MLPHRSSLCPGQSAAVSSIAALLALFSSTLFGEVKLASPFTSHMVLQRSQPIKVWGTAAPSEKVTVEFGGETISATSSATGHWQLELAPLQASAESRGFKVSGSQTQTPIVLDDVLVGEVWLASGQSNMDFTMSKKVKRFAGVANEDQEIAEANYPLVRMFTGAAAKTYEPQKNVEGEWKICSPTTAPAFSAVGYYFARDLQKSLQIPVGIITLSFGASTAESWIRRETMAADPKLKPMLDRFDEAVKTFREHPPAVAGAVRSEDVSAPAAPANPAERRRTGPRDPVQDQHNATVLFNGMIAPVIPYSIRGAIWYQGESIIGGDAGVALYPHVQATLIHDWRELWGEGDFPFYIVQLAGQEAQSNRPEVREAQATILRLKNTGMAVTTDIGEAKNVHPRNKADVGDRLSRIALAQVYDQKIEYSGPQYESMSATPDGAIRIRFSHLGGGLVVKGDGPLKWFSIAGEDKKFVPAEAKIEGDTLVVKSPEVAHPAAVRYAWVNFPNGCNLFNAAGLPAAQFRTDAPQLEL